MPMRTSASSTLTAAMMPSSRFVVSRFPAFIPLAPSVRGPRRRERRLRTRGVEFVHHADTVVGHVAELADRLLKAPEFAPEFVNRGFKPVARLLARPRKEEVTSGCTDC